MIRKNKYLKIALHSNQKQYWNSVANEKEFTTNLNKEIIHKYINPEDFIIDFGCGYGRILNELFSMGYKNTVGYDFSEKLIERGRKIYPHLVLNISDGNTVDIPGNSANMVILFAVLTCFIDNKEQEKLIKEIKRILKPGGYIYVNDFLINDDKRNKDRYAKFENKCHLYGVFELPGGAILRHHKEEWFKEILAGFEIIKYDKHLFKTMNGNYSNGVSVFARYFT